MALFKILRGPSNSIQDEKKVPLRDGYAYFTPDKGNFYIDARTDESNAASVKRIWINPPVAEFDSSEWGKAANDRISIVDKYINYIKPPVVDPANHRMTIYDGEGVGKNVAMNFVNRGGDIMTGDLNFANNDSGITKGIYFQAGTNDGARIVSGATAQNAGYLEIATTDDGNEPIYVRQYSDGGSWKRYGGTPRTLTLLDASGNTSIPGSLTAAKDITAPKFHGIADYAKYDTIEKGKGSNAQEIPTKYMSYSTPPAVNPASHNITIHNGEGGSKTIAANFVNRAGDTMTGALNFANGTWNTVGDDVQIGDINRSGTLGVRGANGVTAIQLVPAGGTMSENNATWSSSAAGASTISGNVAFGGNVTPTIGAKYSLGTSSLRWSKVFTEEMDTTNLYASEGIGNDNFILHPGGGEYSIRGGNKDITGALVIKLPVAKTFMPMSMEVHIYNHHANTSIIYYISGYVAKDIKWTNVTAYTNSNATNAMGNLTVRFGTDANGYGLISIGETNTVWHTPQVSITNVVLPGAFSRWKTGWNISFSTTTIPGVVATIANPTSTLLPYGFTSYTSNATWGNQIGSTITNWNTNGSSIDFRKDNPSNGKLSIKVDGRVYVNEGLNPVMGMTQGQDNFWGMGTPDGDASAWIRTTSSGIIPYQSGGPNAGHNSLGTSSWYFGDVFSTRLNSQWVHADMATNGADGGLTLWGGSPSYGITFRSTSNQGKHGYVTNDYATYFTMDGTANRGWIFKKWRAEAVASINNAGYAQFNKINLNRHSGTNFGRISWYDPAYYTWNDYMSQPAAGAAPTGGQPSTLGNVTTWAKRSLIENISGYGWIWESAANAAAASSTTTPKAIMALSSVNGDLTMTGSIKDLPTGGGIYWNPHVESASDASDAASITQIKSGVAGGTELRIQQQSDSNDVINLVVPDYIYLNGKRAFTINDSWLRINQDLGFSSGIYTGSSVIRSDNKLQVGESGNKFYANSSGDGYFSNTLGIAGKNTNYNLYVNGTSRFNNTLYFFNSIGDTALSIESRRSKNSSNANLETNTGLVTKDKSFIEIRGFAPPTMVRTTGDKPAPYGLGFGNGKESAGIMPIGEGDNLKELMFYGANSGPTLFTWKYQVWEATNHDSDSSNAYSDAAMSLTSKTGDLYVKNTIGIKGQNTGYNLYVNGTSLTAGAATFNGGVTFTHKNFNYSGMENGTQGTYRHVWFSDSATRGKPVYSDGIMYNPTAGLKVTNWVRTTGATGWYNESYGGGWYMSDSTYIRSYNGKSTRLDNLCLGADNNSYRLYVNGASYFNGDLTIPNNHAYYGILGSNSSTVSSNVGGLTWFNISGTAGAQTDVNDTPTTGWWYILRNRHTNTGNNYYTDIAIPFNDTSIYYKIIRNGDVVNNAWTRVLDTNNYTGTLDGRYVKKSGDTMTGDLTVPNLSANQYLRANAYPGYGTGWGGFWYDGGNKNLCAYGDTGGNITFQASKVYGAVWNDYAEYRKTDEIKAGQCVIETGKGDLVQSTARLQPGANIVSNTFGFAIGETENTKTPIAVSGRVLAYPYEERNSYQAGDPVCSGPNGTISKMTREEVREYPDRIVGTVSEIPDYEVWGTGKVKVDGRIWIKVK